jgi:glycosyltransferase involved in cell wall biosynthesis
MIATYRRPVEIERCLTALQHQLLPPNDVIVVAREDDLETRTTLDRLSLPAVPFRLVTVSVPGVVAARNAGILACRTNILAVIDDDTAPHPEWTSRIVQDFTNDPSLGGLGGRDRCFNGTTFDDRKAPTVGRIRWFGRVIGNHHIGFGQIREVDLLKGANMSFRAEAMSGVQFDSRLKGEGTQPGDDKCFSVAVKANGWKLAYDPAAVVDHFPGFRADARQYVGVNRLKDIAHFRSFAYNEVLSIWASLSPLRRVAFFLWSTFIGTGTFPGLIQAIRFTPKLGIYSWQRFWIAQTAKVEAFRDLSL